MKLFFLPDSLYSLATPPCPYSSRSHLESTTKAQYCQAVLYLWGNTIPEKLSSNRFWVKDFCPWLIHVRANVRCTETIHSRAVGTSPISCRSLWSLPEKSGKLTKKRTPIFSCKSEWEIFNQDEIWKALAVSGSWKVLEVHIHARLQTLKAGELTAGDRRDFVFCQLWSSGQILTLIVFSLRLDYFCLQRKMMAAATCNL